MNRVRAPGCTGAGPGCIAMDGSVGRACPALRLRLRLPLPLRLQCQQLLQHACLVAEPAGAGTAGSSGVAAEAEARHADRCHTSRRGLGTTQRFKACGGSKRVIKGMNGQ